MRRSRSSFDLSDAITSAESLSPKPPPVPEAESALGSMPLVAFNRGSVAPAARAASVAEEQRPQGRLAPPPSVENLTTVGARCERLFEWLRADPYTTNVLLVDAEGLPVAHASVRDEAILGATAGVASAIRQLALASPGSVSREFESHVGDRPILSLIGFMVGSKLYVLGLSHDMPLAEHDSAKIRAAFTSALASLHGPAEAASLGGPKSPRPKVGGHG